ncbi:MAG: WD40/YVTN/BNR-like repeat-containing protein, partial [Nitrospinota bacterium]
MLLAALLASGLGAGPVLAHHISMRPGFFGHVVVDLALSPWDSASLYVVAFGQGVFVSSDGGRSWKKLNEGLTELSVRVLAFQRGTPGREQAGTLYLGTDWGAFRRSAGGRWEPLPGLRGRSVRVLRVGAGSPSALFAGTEAGVFASFDGGRTWERRSRGLTNPDVRALALDPRGAGRLYAGTFGGIFRSEDGGRSWQAASEGLADPRVRALVLDPHRPGHLFAGTAGGGVFESLEGGRSWRAANERLWDSSVMAL